MKAFIVNCSMTFILFAAFCSCGNRYFFEDYRHVPETGWHKDSVLIFKIPADDTLSNFDMYLNIRNNVNYRYSNLWVFTEIVQPGGEVVKDTFEIVLADHSGRWLGDGFAGLKTRQAIYRRQFFFPVSGDYHIKVQHGMRQDLLKGITDVGIRISRNVS